MSKKKQLTGKKTKLAKLPLTAALSRQLEEPANFTMPEVAPVPGPQQFMLSWERLEEGAAGLLTAAYILVVQDLLSLKAEVPWTVEESFSPGEIIPNSALPAHRVKQALRQAKEELSDLYRLLSG